MNKSYILYNLKESLIQLEETIKELENNSDYEYGEFSVDMNHLYHHINTAWNSKYSTEKESKECSENNFRIWRKFPTDIEMSN
jgi:hypothetical protein